jgi:hypothetical protein
VFQIRLAQRSGEENGVSTAENPKKVKKNDLSA